MATLRTPEFRGVQRVDITKCTGCSLCSIHCPTGAIKMKRVQGRRAPYPTIDYSLCIYCYQCVYVCPFKAYVVSDKPMGPLTSRPPVHDPYEEYVKEKGEPPPEPRMPGRK